MQIRQETTTTAHTGVARAWGIRVSARANGLRFVNGGASETIFRNEPETLKKSTVYSISYNPYNRKVYVATSDYTSNGKIYVFAADGQYETSFSSYGINPNKIVFLK